MLNKNKFSVKKLQFMPKKNYSPRINEQIEKIMPKEMGKKCFNSIISPCFNNLCKIVKKGAVTAPTMPPSNAPKKAPTTKMKTPPAPPAITPHNKPINGTVKSILVQDKDSASAKLFPKSFPVK